MILSYLGSGRELYSTWNMKVKWKVWMPQWAPTCPPYDWVPSCRNFRRYHSHRTKEFLKKCNLFFNFVKYTNFLPGIIPRIRLQYPTSESTISVSSLLTRLFSVSLSHSSSTPSMVGNVVIVPTESFSPNSPQIGRMGSLQEKKNFFWILLKRS